MFAQQLYAQWRWNRDFLAFYMVVGFGVPLVILWIVAPMTGIASAGELVGIGQAIGGAVLTVALLAGITVAAQGYAVDDRAGHVYALSLPVTRPRFLATRTLSAFILLALPALAIWLGGALAAGQTAIPATLQSYAGWLAVRALLAAWLAHSCIFALRYSAGKRMQAVLLVTLVSIVGATLLALEVAPASRPLLSRVADFLVSHPGPFGVIFGRWTLFDV